MVAVMVVVTLIETFIAAKYVIAGEKARDGRFIDYPNEKVLEHEDELDVGGEGQ
jgi:hypothetical protein